MDIDLVTVVVGGHSDDGSGGGGVQILCPICSHLSGKSHTMDTQNMLACLLTAAVTSQSHMLLTF